MGSAPEPPAKPPPTTEGTGGGKKYSSGKAAAARKKGEKSAASEFGRIAVRRRAQRRDSAGRAFGLALAPFLFWLGLYVEPWWPGSPSTISGRRVRDVGTPRRATVSPSHLVRASRETDPAGQWQLGGPGRIVLGSPTHPAVQHHGELRVGEAAPGRGVVRSTAAVRPGQLQRHLGRVRKASVPLTASEEPQRRVPWPGG